MAWRRMLAAAVAVGSTLVVAPAAMAAVPVVSASMPQDLAPKSATLVGSVNPSSLQTTYHFEWDFAGSGFCNGTPTAAAARSGADGVVEAFDGLTTVKEPVTDLSPETTYCFRIVAHNASGTSTSSRVNFTTPPLPPNTTLFKKPAGLVTTRTVEMGFNSNIPGSYFECSVDGADWEECETPYTLTGLADGTHTFEVRAVDPRTDLVDETPDTSTFRVYAGTTSGGGTTGGGSGTPGTVPTGPVSAAPAPIAAAPKIGRAGHAKLKGSKLTTGQKVSCAGTGEVCKVTVKLTGSAKGSKKLAKVGAARMTVAAGASKAVVVKLNAKGRKLLKKAHALKVVSLVTVKRGKRIPVTAGVKLNVKKK